MSPRLRGTRLHGFGIPQISAMKKVNRKDIDDLRSSERNCRNGPFRLPQIRKAVDSSLLRFSEQNCFLNITFRKRMAPSLRFPLTSLYRACVALADCVH